MLNTFRGTRGPRATRIGEPPQTAEEREIREERAAASSGSGGAENGERRRRRLLQGNVHSLGSTDPELEAAVEDWRRKEVPYHLLDRAVYPLSVDCLR